MPLFGQRRTEPGWGIKPVHSYLLSPHISISAFSVTHAPCSPPFHTIPPLSPHHLLPSPFALAHVIHSSISEAVVQGLNRRGADGVGRACKHVLFISPVRKQPEGWLWSSNNNDATFSFWVWVLIYVVTLLVFLFSITFMSFAMVPL